MPVDSKEILSGIGSKLNAAPIIGTITKNPFYTAVLISIIIMLVVLFVFRNALLEEESESLTKLALRTGLYSLFLVTGIQFLQNQHVFDEVKAGGQSAKLDEVFDESGRATLGPAGVLKTANSKTANKETKITGGNEGLEPINPDFVPAGVDVSFI